MGAAFSDDEGGTMSDINVTPLVDVVLVLLIVFMVTIPSIVGNAAIKVELPETASAGAANLSLAEKIPLEIFVRRDNGGEVAMYLGERRVDLDGIGAFVNSLEDRSEQTVKLAAEKGIPYGEVVKVMDLLGGAGMTKLSLNTKYTGP